MALLEEANEMDPSNWQPLFNIAIVAGFDLQQFDIAFDAVEKLESMDPTPPRLGELRQALETAQAGGQPSGG